MAPNLVISIPGGPRPSNAYYACRYACLRQPLGFPVGSERLADDNEAIHAWWEINEDEVVAVGRIHRIADNSDGAQTDHAGADAAVCPAFEPLIGDGGEMRPAVQIRQMGTLEEWRRQGLASGLVVALEAAAVSHWGAKTGWLQARVAAIPMYESEGWVQFGEEYDVKGIGSHYSMWKILSGEDLD